VNHLYLSSEKTAIILIGKCDEKQSNVARKQERLNRGIEPSQSLLKAAANLAREVEDMSFVSEPVDRRAGEGRVAEYVLPAVKGEVRSDNDGTFVIARQ
jgi:hypothetical protein